MAKHKGTMQLRTPTTDEIRMRASFVPNQSIGMHVDERSLAEFNRWLAAHDQEIAAQTRADDALTKALAAVCGMCGRRRGLQDPYDYNPIQVIVGVPLGWYSGDDGQLCGPCMTRLMTESRGA